MIPASKTKLWMDFVTFSGVQLTNRDVDPVYPVLKALLPEDKNKQRWLVGLYLAYYNLGSALRVFDRTDGRPRALDAEELRFPTGIERRGLRGGKNMRAHLDSLMAHDALGCATRTWDETRWAFEEIKFNGRWASYKAAEVCQKVLGWPIKAPDMGNDGSTGPRRGLELFFGPSNDITELDVRGAAVQDALQANLNLTIGIEEVETLLCDFHSMVKGHYYPGEDIDMLQDQAIVLPATHSVWRARADTLPNDWLGEMRGWRGVSKERRAYYARTGKVLTHPLMGPR